LSEAIREFEKWVEKKKRDKSKVVVKIRNPENINRFFRWKQDKVQL